MYLSACTCPHVLVRMYLSACTCPHVRTAPKGLRFASRRRRRSALVALRAVRRKTQTQGHIYEVSYMRLKPLSIG